MTSPQKLDSPYIPNTPTDKQLMLKAIGVASASELFKDIPEGHRISKLDIPEAVAELDLIRQLNTMAESNIYPGKYSCFLGAGVYHH